MDQLAQEKKSLRDYRKQLHVSHTQIATYLLCPRKYRYQYVIGAEWERIPAAMPFGKAIHLAAARFYRRVKELGTKPAFVELSRVFAGSWKREVKDPRLLFKPEDGPDQLFHKGLAMLKHFWEKTEPQRVEAVEFPFSVHLIDESTGEVLPVKLVGVFDLIESDSDGTMIIADLKTAARRWADEKSENNLQGSIYSYALKQLGHVTTGRETLIRFDVLLKTQKPALERYFAVRNDFDHRRVVKLIQQLLRAIEQEIYYPNVGWHCSECPFKQRCDQEP